MLSNLSHMFAAHHEKSFVPAFFKVSNDHLFDNLESWKKILILEKSLEKVLTFGSKNLYEPWNNGDMCIARLEPPLTPPKKLVSDTLFGS